VYLFKQGEHAIDNEQVYAGMPWFLPRQPLYDFPRNAEPLAARTHKSYRDRMSIIPDRLRVPREYTWYSRASSRLVRNRGGGTGRPQKGIQRLRTEKRASVLALTEDSQITKMVRVCGHEDAGMHLAVS
jgi:hypothetical protein